METSLTKKDQMEFIKRNHQSGISNKFPYTTYTNMYMAYGYAMCRSNLKTRTYIASAGVLELGLDSANNPRTWASQAQLDLNVFIMLQAVFACCTLLRQQ